MSLSLEAAAAHDVDVETDDDGDDEEQEDDDEWGGVVVMRKHGAQIDTVVEFGF